MMATKYMKIHITMLIGILFFTNAIKADAVNTQNSPTSQKIEQLIQQHLPDAYVGIIVRDAESGKQLYARNAQKLFTPASGTKLFTASAALLALGPDFHFETTVKEKDDTLYFQFSGDPTLNSQNLNDLIVAAKTSDLSHIREVYMDDTRFQGLNYALGWDWNTTWWYYGAPITTVILNKNALSIRLLPTNGPNEKISAELKMKAPDTFVFPTLNTDVSSVTNEEANQCTFMVDTDSENNIHLSGCWPVQKEETSIKIAVKNPILFAKQMILAFFKTDPNLRRIIEIKTGVDTKKLPDLKTIAVHRSKSLQELLTEVLQDSDNVCAESLTKTLGAEFAGEGTFNAGVRVIQKTLKDHLGLDFTKILMMDGSGLSRYNLISPYLFSELLYKMYHHKELCESFKNVLAVSGESGTLKCRMQPKTEKQPAVKQEQQPKIYAKTGTLTGVSTLSGYIDTKRGRTLIFSIMINNAQSPSSDLKKFEDALCRLFFDYFQ